MSRRWQFWLGLLVSAAFLWVALRALKIEEVFGILRAANYAWLLPGVAVYFVAVVARSWRWQALLKPLKVVSIRKLFPVVVIGYMGNNILPARSGEVLRSYVLKRKENVPVSASLATVIVERVFDGVVMLGFVIFNLPALAAVTGDSGFVGSIQQAAIIGVLIFSGALAAFLLAALFPHQSLNLFHRLAEPLIPGKFRPRVVGLAVKFWTGLESLRSPANIAMVFLT